MPARDESTSSHHALVSAAPLGRPGPRAAARRAGPAPHAIAVTGARQPAHAGRALRTGGNPHPHDPVGRHLAIHIDGEAAFVKDPAATDRQAVAVSPVAGPTIGDDQHAPVAVIIGGAGHGALSGAGLDWRAE